MINLLLVEDNETIITGLTYALSQESFEVDVARTAYETRQKLQRQSYDLLILDVSLPDGDGFEICKEVKKKDIELPIIFLTAKDEEKDVVLGLEIGADDYVIKPFRTKELISRIRTVLRRYHKKEEKSTIQIKDITIDLAKAEVYKGKRQVILTALEYKILLMLFQNQNRLITREQLLDKIWDVAGNFVNDNTLTVYIKRIREKIENNPAEPEIIKTIRGIGYKVGE